MIELLVTLIILATLTTLAAPSFSMLFERWRVNQAAADLESTLFFARSESIRRGGSISITRNLGNGSCNPSDEQHWECGWSVIIDRNQDGLIDNDTTPLQTTQAFSRVRIAAEASIDTIFFDRWGYMQFGAAGNTFSYAVQSESARETTDRRLCIYSGGRIQQLPATSQCES